VRNLIIRAIETAGDADREELLDLVAELVTRLDAQKDALVAAKRERRRISRERQVALDNEHNARVDLQMERTKIPQSDDGTYRRLQFLEGHVKDLNGRINAAAEDAYRRGFLNGRIAV